MQTQQKPMWCRFSQAHQAITSQILYSDTKK